MSSETTDYSGSDGPILRVDNVSKYFGGEQGLVDTLLRRRPTPVRAVDSVSMEVEKGEIMGIAGESGCGKTTLGKLMVNLYQPTAGEIYFEDTPYSELRGRDLKEFRKRVQMIFQDPFESLNPRFTVMDTVSEPLRVNDIAKSYDERRKRVIRALEDAGLEPAEEYLQSFPRELSGGEQQRVAIARALVVDPDFILADEPVSMLDVSIRAGVLNLMKELRDEYDLTYVFISHDLSLIRYMCDRTAIMYLGDVVEIGDTEDVVTDPQHPYTQALLDAVPTPDPTRVRNRARIEGQIPSPDDPPAGCKFHPRCPKVIQPGPYDLDQQTWRSVMDLRLAVTRGEVHLERTRENVAADTGVGSAEEVPPADVADAIREEYGISEPLSDSTAEARLEEILDQVARGDVEEAAATFQDAFPTVCREQRPELFDAGPDHGAACHLHNPQVAAEPDEERVVQSDD